MFVTIINDCRDDNAAGRIMVRASSLFAKSPVFIGVDSGLGAIQEMADVQAAGNLVDVLDAGLGKEGVVMVNVAPRGGRGKQWKNGTPFGFFWYNKTLVCSTVDGLVLSLAKQLQVIESLHITNMPDVLAVFEQQGILTAAQREYITNTQFRSFEYLPRLAHALWSGVSVPSELYELNNIEPAPQAIWFIDNFGNCKTTLTRDQLTIADGWVKTKFGKLPFFERLKDVPDKTVALVVGSSGLEHTRFVEVVGQGVSAAQKLSLSVGDAIV